MASVEDRFYLALKRVDNVCMRDTEHLHSKFGQYISNCDEIEIKMAAGFYEDLGDDMWGPVNECFEV